jgi:hypothetical protein
MPEVLLRGCKTAELEEAEKGDPTPEGQEDLLNITGNAVFCEG